MQLNNDLNVLYSNTNWFCAVTSCLSVASNSFISVLFAIKSPRVFTSVLPVEKGYLLLIAPDSD